jgi:predicted SAM-dependent methyltransferase
VSLTRRLGEGEFEDGLSLAQLVYYGIERRLGHAFLRRAPPSFPGDRLLNLGCGPHCFDGWVNADDYGFKRSLREPGFRPNWRLDIARPWRCPPDHWDGIFTEHVIEHLSYSEAIRAFRECLRTLKPGSWLRVSVPDLGKYVTFYEGGRPHPDFDLLPHRAVGLSFVTQMHMHRSAWDADLLVKVLTELGFRQAQEVGFGVGADARLVREDPDKAGETVYVEARKP